MAGKLEQQSLEPGVQGDGRSSKHQELRLPSLPLEIHEMIIAEISLAARNVQSEKQWRELVGNSLCVCWFWNTTLTKHLLKNCNIQTFLAYAREQAITEMAVTRWIDQVSENRNRPLMKRRMSSEEDDGYYNDACEGQWDEDEAPTNSPALRYSNNSVIITAACNLKQELPFYVILATSRGFSHCLRSLINVRVSVGISISNEDFQRTRLMHEAVRSGTLETVNLLLGRGIDASDRSRTVTSVQPYYMLPIAMAVQRVHVDIADVILSCSLKH
ncbi:uncharacterized protein PADG_01308 [Paracoccidioides brasiliensis Pb18]|uniref:Uncharacterized protein n=1 Tax=Paracoccidioides brasiliensis (strain Pb18) TaxID=502780 RepID=C1G2Z2_PARBD|nr:uncharacterized protein PADG_01308 [Paracoccidioides brasiliensis Pb18]EEH45158.2 hypothetical protein PADG_01308 [Paracoccidioides brasiliensis Pb18]